MLSFETYEKINKKESYSIYTDLYQQKKRARFPEDATYPIVSQNGRHRQIVS